MYILDDSYGKELEKLLDTAIEERKQDSVLSDDKTKPGENKQNGENEIHKRTA
jgi:hypothetical protein